MAYNKKNYYRRVVEIQELVRQKKMMDEDLTYKEIFHKFVERQYHISKRTFDEYLGVPAKRELKLLEENEKTVIGEQLKLNF